MAVGFMIEVPSGWYVASVCGSGVYRSSGQELLEQGGVSSIDHC